MALPNWPKHQMGVKGEPVRLEVIQGRRNVQEFVYRLSIEQNTAKPVPETWRDDILTFPGVQQPDLTGIKDESHRFVCEICPGHKAPADLHGLAGHIQGKRHRSKVAASILKLDEVFEAEVIKVAVSVIKEAVSLRELIKEA